MEMEEVQPTAALSGQIVQLDGLDGQLIERIRHEVLTAPAPWKAEYGEFQSRGWWTTSLMNTSGDAAEVRITDGVARPTALLEHMPATAGLLAGLGLSYMWVRLEPNVFLWQHRDYDELDRVERHRLRTNSSAASSAHSRRCGCPGHIRPGAGMGPDRSIRPRHGLCVGGHCRCSASTMRVRLPLKRLVQYGSWGRRCA